MGDYFAFFIFLQMYGMITAVSLASKSPISIVGYKTAMIVQFVLVTATFVYPVFDPLHSVGGIIAWVMYCASMYILLFFQVSSLRAHIIDTNQIYDCKIWGKLEENNVCVYFGEIKPWKDTINVMLINTKERHKGDVVKVVYEAGDFKELKVRKKNEEEQRYETVSVIFRVVPTDD